MPKKILLQVSLAIILVLIIFLNTPNSINAATCTGSGCTSGVSKCTNGNEGVDTAIGCIPTDPQAFVKGLLTFALGAAGGIALLIMAFSGISMILAAGNQEAVKAARDRFTSAVIGLLFIILSVFLLQVIGANILNIPGFG